MKLFLISDNLDTYTGMRLAGVDGVVVHEKEDFINKLNTAMADKEIGIILIAERFYNNFSDVITEMKLNKRIPLLISIPDRHSSGAGTESISSYINEAIGIKF